MQLLLAGGPSADELEAFTAGRTKFRVLWTEAIKRSRRETIDEVEERDGSRNLYTEKVAPAADALNEAANTLQADVEKLSNETADRLRSLNEHCLAGLQRGLELVRDGNLTYEVTPVTTPVEVESTDELGQLSETFNGMLGKAQISIDAYNDMRGQLGALIGEVDGSAGTLSAASQQMASTSDEAGRAVGEIANAVGEIWHRLRAVPEF